MPQYTTKLTSVGVDWLTCSAGEDKGAAELRRYGVERLMESAGKGNKVGPFKRGVYYGGGTRHVGFGEYKGRVLVEARGRVANDIWREVLPLAEKVSRIDLQVSVRQEPYDKNLALRCWAKSLVSATQEGKPPEYDLYARRGQGSTLYIGSGSSRFHARLYERWWKEKIDENQHTWRYEVQARRERATQLSELLSAASTPGVFTAGTVHAHFLRRGVPPIFKAEAQEALAPLPDPEPDDDRAVNWLIRSCLPVIRRLRDHGHTDRIDRLLGHGPAAEPEQDELPEDIWLEDPPEEQDGYPMWADD